MELGFTRQMSDRTTLLILQVYRKQEKGSLINGVPPKEWMFVDITFKEQQLLPVSKSCFKHCFFVFAIGNLDVLSTRYDDLIAHFLYLWLKIIIIQRYSYGSMEIWDWMWLFNIKILFPMTPTVAIMLCAAYFM